MPFLLIAAIMASAQAQLHNHENDAHALRGGGPIAAQSSQHPCVTDEQARVIHAAIDANRRLLNLNDSEGLRTPPALYRFYPIGGNHGNDVFHGGFVDVDPTSPGYNDYNCTAFTYDGHAGIDTPIRSFGEQLAGVAVFSVCDGTCVFSQDGWPDMNINGGEQGNIVAIQPVGESREISYYHLKNGSVAVSVGQFVKAGTQIGMVGSSGNSFGPHLHFETRDNPGYVVYEPFAGPCRAGPSGFVSQPPMLLNCFFDDFGITHMDLNPPAPQLPYPLPREGQIGLDDQYLRFWVKGHNLPINSTWRVRFFRPDNSLASDSNWFFYNDSLWRDYWFWWEYEVAPLFNVLGTWKIQVDFNDQLMVLAPVEIRTTRTAGFNRPPQPITVAFDPPAPAQDDVIFCRVNTSVLVDDLDYDMVRYHYLWRVDGSVVRDVTTAGQADAILHTIACPGSTVTCTVTPNDGTVDGSSAIASLTLPGTLIPDMNCDCLMTTADISPFVQTLLNPANSPGCVPSRADANHDTLINGRDISAFVDALLP